MSVTLKSVLISDPVDQNCAELLTKHGITVSTKYKLSKDELIKELVVSFTIIYGLF
jgi:D-3-phosphoglycerate dehydrogenase